MNEQEYRDMYAEYCMESGTRMTDRGFTEFKAWRERVEKLFEKDADQPLTIPSAYGIVRYNEKQRREGNEDGNVDVGSDGAAIRYHRPDGNDANAKGTLI